MLQSAPLAQAQLHILGRPASGFRGEEKDDEQPNDAAAREEIEEHRAAEALQHDLATLHDAGGEDPVGDGGDGDLAALEGEDLGAEDPDDRAERNRECHEVEQHDGDR